MLYDTNVSRMCAQPEARRSRHGLTITPSQCWTCASKTTSRMGQDMLFQDMLFLSQHAQIDIDIRSKHNSPMASTSSKKTMQAFLERAIWNNSLTIRAPSPTYFCTSSLPMTRMKHASVLFATALAESVFPVPGGPKSKIPLGGSIPRVTNFSGWRRGNSTTSLSFSSASLQPPTSLYVTSGFSST